MHHGHFSKHVLELVYTEYEVHRSIIRHGRPIQLTYLVFCTLTGVLFEEIHCSVRHAPRFLVQRAC